MQIILSNIARLSPVMSSALLSRAQWNIKLSPQTAMYPVNVFNIFNHNGLHKPTLDKLQDVVHLRVTKEQYYKS